MSLLNQISSELNLTTKFIENVLNQPKRQYRIYYIKKKKGGNRKIFHPSPTLKTLQYWMLDNVLNDLDVSKYSTGYRKNMSIKNNANVHKNSCFILNMDIADFFQSIKSNHINEILEDKGYMPLDIHLFNKICFYDGFLPMGSVSSPHISNCVMYKFDMELVNKLPKGFKYTRYADDITLSSKVYIKDTIQVIVEDLLEKYSFNANHSKTRYMSNGQSQIITGLNVNNGEVTIGTRRKKQLKKDLYNNLTKNLGDPEVILGRLNFLKSIEPDYFNRIIVKYSKHGNVLEKLKVNIKKQQTENVKIKEQI